MSVFTCSADGDLCWLPQSGGNGLGLGLGMNSMNTDMDQEHLNYITHMCALMALFSHYLLSAMTAAVC